jgi:hypothetical protein
MVTWKKRQLKGGRGLQFIQGFQKFNIIRILPALKRASGDRFRLNTLFQHALMLM